MPNDPMAEIKASFFIECDELLESLQDALTEIEEGAHDGETINIVFRAVHSIKGGAGAFGLEALVAFAHRYETVMDEVRSGRLEVSVEAVKLFFQAADLLADEVHAARDSQPEPEGAEACLKGLEALLGADRLAEAETDDAPPYFQPMGLSLDLATDFDIGQTPPDAHVLHFKPHADLYASGNEPLYLLRALADLGPLETEVDFSAIPPLDAIDPEAAYLSWTLRLDRTLDEAAIRDVFDFVEDVCDLEFGSQENPLDSFGDVTSLL
ncbi:MAG: Hpt domain-containing protein, partial [Thioclava sp.]